jgi:hypothetical protein
MRASGHSARTRNNMPLPACQPARAVVRRRGLLATVEQSAFRAVASLGIRVFRTIRAPTPRSPLSSTLVSGVPHRQQCRNQRFGRNSFVARLRRARHQHDRRMREFTASRPASRRAFAPAIRGFMNVGPFLDIDRTVGPCGRGPGRPMPGTSRNPPPRAARMSHRSGSLFVSHGAKQRAFVLGTNARCRPGVP